jgi:uncharacterized membrane protein YfcA
MIAIILLLGLGVGLLVGLLGIGGGVVLVPAMVYLFHFDQHLAQGTSLLVLLAPVGLGALREYWKKGCVDWYAGALCAAGIFVGGYLGGLLAVPMSSQHLQGLFGGFLMLAAFFLWHRTRREANSQNPCAEDISARGTVQRRIGIFLIAGVCGVFSGMFGVGGGVLLIPLLVLLFGFSQHRAQGTSLVALIAPSGLAAFMVYAKSHYVDWQAGLLLIPGMFVGGVAGGFAASKIQPRRMRQIFAVVLRSLGAWQAIAGWK